MVAVYEGGEQKLCPVFSGHYQPTAESDACSTYVGTSLIVHCVVVIISSNSNGRKGLYISSGKLSNFEMESNILVGAQFRISDRGQFGKKCSGNKSPRVKSASGNPRRALQSFLHLKPALHHCTLVSSQCALSVHSVCTVDTVCHKVVFYITALSRYISTHSTAKTVQYKSPIQTLGHVLILTE